MSDVSERFSSTRRRGQRGQSAVETMFMIPVLLLVFVGMYELFSITFASQHAHIRAREYVLHNGRYIEQAPAGENAGGSSVFSSSNYRVADKDIWGAGGSGRGYTAWAHDRGVPGIGPDASDPGTRVCAAAYICSPSGCPATSGCN